MVVDELEKLKQRKKKKQIKIVSDMDDRELYSVIDEEQNLPLDNENPFEGAQEIIARCS